jgi:hypothetical protein
MGTELASTAPLEAVDLAVRRASGASSAWQDSLRKAKGAPFAPAPLGQHRSVAGKTAFDALRARVVLSHDDALRAALCRWVGALTVLRVTEDERAEEAEALTEESALVHLAQVEKTSFTGAWKGFVRSRNPAEATAWLGALSARGAAVAAVRRERAVREEEAVRRLGFSTWDELVSAAKPGALDAAAVAFLRGTRDLAVAMRREAERRGGADARAGTFAGVVTDATGRDAPEGWPARLTTRTLVETLGAPPDVGRGLRIDVALPDVVGAASFARGLESFGVAYRRAAAVGSSLPFAVAVDPYFVDAYRFGFAFGGLPAHVAYQRHLGLGVARARQQARTLAKIALLHARGVAASSLLARDAARPDRSRFQELVHDVYGEAVPEGIFGAFPRPRGDEHARVQALLTTLPFTSLLRDRFEEDWFRNPHAWRFLRARASGPARGPEEDDEQADAVALARAFEEALG